MAKVAGSVRSSGHEGPPYAGMILYDPYSFRTRAVERDIINLEFVSGGHAGKLPVTEWDITRGDITVIRLAATDRNTTGYWWELQSMVYLVKFLPWNASKENRKTPTILLRTVAVECEPLVQHDGQRFTIDFDWRITPLDRTQMTNAVNALRGGSICVRMRESY